MLISSVYNLTTNVAEGAFAANELEGLQRIYMNDITFALLTLSRSVVDSEDLMQLIR